MKAVTTAENRPALTHSDINFGTKMSNETTHEDQEVLDLVLPCLASRFILLFLCFQ